jgi:hypothetical protein
MAESALSVGLGPRLGKANHWIRTPHSSYAHYSMRIGSFMPPGACQTDVLHCGALSKISLLQPPDGHRAGASARDAPQAMQNSCMQLFLAALLLGNAPIISRVFHA